MLKCHEYALLLLNSGRMVSRSSGVGGFVFMAFAETAVNISYPAWNDDDQN